MDWLTFFTKLAEALAWPAVVLVVVFLLRPEIRGLLSLLKRVKAGPVEAEFEREVKQLQSEAEQLPAPAAAEGLEAPAMERTRLVELAELDPRVAIIEAWRELELTTRAALSRVSVKLSAREASSPLALAKAVSTAELLSPEELTLFNELRVLRNRAVHAENFAVSLDAAMSYIEVAKRIRAAIEDRLKAKVPQPEGFGSW